MQDAPHSGAGEVVSHHKSSRGSVKLLSLYSWCDVLCVGFHPAAESQCRCSGVCMCQHFPGGAAEPDHPRFPPEGRCEAPGAHVAGQEPERQRDGHWSAQVSRCGLQRSGCLPEAS